jgi:hypothetical protein
MNYNEFLTRVIDEGIEAATADYTKESEKQQLEGSIAGFNACRDKSPEELVEVWKQAGKRTEEASHEVYKTQSKGDYWYHRCFQSEVEWVCNVVSAMLMNQGNYAPLLSWLPTANGAMKAASIIGVNQMI